MENAQLHEEFYNTLKSMVSETQIEKFWVATAAAANAKFEKRKVKVPADKHEELRADLLDKEARERLATITRNFTQHRILSRHNLGNALLHGVVTVSVGAGAIALAGYLTSRKSKTTSPFADTGEFKATPQPAGKTNLRAAASI